MSIVIKGMRMPENCASCPFAERIPPGRTRCLLTHRFLAQDYEAPPWLGRNEYCPIEERPTGRWVEEDDGWDGIYWSCSECGESYTLIDGTPQENEYHFCPNCGAKMNGGKGK